MLLIENSSRGTTLMDKGRMANNFWSRFRGLMGVRDLPPGDGLLITPCSSIHTHFMAIPIDILYVDEADQVVDLEPAMATWQIGARRKDAKYVIELPSGMIAQTATQVGDKLKVEQV